ncbi:MAG: hypothetical protein P1S60_14565, partial [Anaerolineae bacterium]|nr:hypothetical protein [Anaerolineae bacterium]
QLAQPKKLTQQENQRNPLPGEILHNAEQAHHITPDDFLTLQNAVGNRAIQSIAKHRPLILENNLSLDASNTQSLSPNAVIQRADDQAENLYSERNFVRITNEQQQQIDNFASRAQTLVAPWGELRQSVSGTEGGPDHGTYLTGVRQIKSALHTTYRDFTRDFGETVTTQPTESGSGALILPPTHHHQVPFYQHNMARIELARQLNQGFFPQYFREIQTLHDLDGANLIGLKELMVQHAGLEFPRFAHTYRLRTIIGIEGGAGEVVTAGAFIRAFVIEYANELGMSWRVNTYGGALKVGAGVSLSPVEANIDSSMGSNEINAGTAREFRYCPPSYFRANLVSAQTAGAGVGGGYALGQISFGDVTFDTTGLTVRFGTSDVGEAGVDIALGAFFGGEAYDVQDLAEPQAAELQPRGAQWVPVIAGRCHFRTEEALLDSEDEANIDRVVEAIVRHERFYPGDVFRIGVKGFASQRWSTPTASARRYGVDTSDIEEESSSQEERESLTAERLNEALARNRARIAGDALENRILARAGEFTPGVMDRSTLHDNQYEVIHVEDPDADTDAATNRYVQIAVYYNDTAEGNINYNPMVE